MACLLILAACGGAPFSDGGEPELEVVEGVDGPSMPLIAVGDVLLAAPTPEESGVDGITAALHRSDDRGRTWEPVGLPGAPTHLEVQLSHLPGPGLAVVTGREVVESLDMQVPGGGTYVWTSADGHAWHGGPLVTDAPPFVDVVVQAPDGDDGVLVAGVAVGGDLVEVPSRYTLHRSDDGGATWTPAEVRTDLTVAAGGRMELLDTWTTGDGRLVADLGLGPLIAGTGPGGDDDTVGPGGAGSPPPTVIATGGTASTLPSPPPLLPVGVQAVLASDDGGQTWSLAPCPPEAVEPDGGSCSRPDTYGELLIRYTDVSVDGGRSWARPTIEGEPVTDEFSFRHVVELDGGGWLATADDDNDETIEGYLLRSDDGRTWDDVMPAAEVPCDVTLDSTGFIGPVPFGDGWLVAHHCSDFHDPVRTEAFTLDADGTNPTAVPGSHRDQARYDTLTLVDGTATLLTTNTDGSTDLVLIAPG